MTGGTVAPSKWKEADGSAWIAGLRDASGYTRRTDDARLLPGRDVEIVSTDDGPVLQGVQSPDAAHGDTEGLLERFVRLADGEDADLVGFVEQWGFLELCEDHALPWRHDPTCATERREAGRLPCREPVAAWRRISRQYRAALAVGAALHRGKGPRESDWHLLWPPEQGFPFDILAGLVRFEDRDAERSGLARFVDRQLRIAGSRPVVTWAGGQERPDIRIGGDGLSQVLARELALTLARLDGLAVCDGCGNPYAPERKPRADRRSFCETCREAGVPARLRKRDQRARKRREGESDG